MQSVKMTKKGPGKRKTIPLNDRRSIGSQRIRRKMGAQKKGSQRVWESNEEDEGTVEGRANLNERSASDAQRWPLMGPRVARLRKEVQTLKKQHVRWHVRRPHLPRGLKARPLSLFAENEFSTRD